MLKSLSVVLTLTAAVLAAPGAIGRDASAAPPTAAVPPAGLPPAILQPKAAKALILDAVVAGKRLVAVGERGHILLSDDNGVGWRQVKVPVDSALTAVEFVDDRRGWAVGHDSVILATEDAGETWALQFADPDLQQPLMDLKFRDAQNGVAVGAYSLYLETADGGITWTERRIHEFEDGYDYHFNAIQAADATTWFIAGEAGTLLISRDAGANWAPVTPKPYEGSFFDAMALTPNSWLAYGLQGNIYRTDDSGRTWREIATGTTAGIMGGTRLNDGRIFLVGLQGIVLTSTDGGRNFTLLQRPDRVALADAVTAPDGSLILLGEDGALPPTR